ncbi:protein of unknown function [Butyrivibrio sp. YAB3001]|nr:protein of unknown function [Butyrivibrio sp. YAB3001]
MVIGMKRRIIVLNCFLCAVLLSACTLGGQNSQNVNKDETDDFVLINDNYSVIYASDLEGNITGKYDIEDIKKIFAENGSSFTPRGFELEHDGILYYYCYEGEDYLSRIEAYFAVDPVKREIAEIFREEDDEYVDTFDYYNGFFYSAVKTGSYDSEQTYKVYKIAKEKDELKYTVSEDDSLKAFYDTILFYNADVNRVKGQYKECYEKILGEQGFVLRELNDEIFKIDAQGNAECIVSLSDKRLSTSGYNNKFLLFYIMDGSYNAIGYYYYDFDQNKICDINIEPSVSSIEALDEGVMYYTHNDSTEYGMRDASLHSYDLVSGKDRTIITRKGVPGTLYYSPLSSPIIKKGKVIFRDFKGQKIGWYMSDIEDADNTIVELAIEPEHVDTFDYGTVEYTSVTSCCPHCGYELDKLYCETFQLDYHYSEFSDVINKALYAKTNEIAERIRNANENNSDEYCDEHEEWSQVTEEVYEVTKVNIINDRYLAVYENSYWYGGGAHGMPSRDQYLFDLQTGKQLTFEDFYKGTEEEFKTLIATKVKEDYESYEDETGENSSDDNPYFAQDSDSAYEVAYESVNYYNIYFEEDGIIYYFFPYDLGPYSSGFIEVFASYEEVFGVSTLGG